MNIHSHSMSPIESNEPAKEPIQEARTISFRVPRLKLPSLQAAILILLVVVGVLQTVQLYGLNLQIASAQVDIGGSPTVSAPTASSSATSSLPNMVGGC